MALALCVVSFEDAEDVEHAVSVQAESAYEAAAMALKLFRADPLTAALMERVAVLKIETKPTPVVHRLEVNKLTRWAENLTGTPAERTRKLRVKALLS